MKKKLYIGVVLMMFATASVVSAKTFKCEVVGVDGDEGIVTLSCDKGDAGKVDVGEKISLKTKKKSGAIEGC